MNGPSLEALQLAARIQDLIIVEFRQNDFTVPDPSVYSPAVKEAARRIDAFGTPKLG